MATIELTTSNFEKNVSAGGILIIDCWAAWCGPCKMFAPKFEKVAADNPDHVFAKLDTQAEPELVAQLGVEHIPSLLVYRDGTLLFKEAGTFDEQILVEILRQAESEDTTALLTRASSAETRQTDS
jgi:thioredoxin 1